MDDLKAIRRNIQEEYGNPKAAMRITNAIFHQYAVLKQLPQSGTVLRARLKVDADICYLVSEGYIIFYQIEGAFVFIGVVIHGKSTHLHLLFQKRKKSALSWKTTPLSQVQAFF